MSGSTTLSTSPPEEDKTVDLTMNCHAAAWAAMRAYQGDDRAVEIFNGEMGRDSQGLGMLLAN